MNFSLQIRYKTVKGQEVDFTSERLNAEEALTVAEDLEKTGRLRQIQIFDNSNQSWSLKELKKYMQGIQTEPHDITVYFDGGYDVKTSKAGLGCAIYYQQNQKRYRVRLNASVEEIHSNNEAEYAALHLSIKELAFRKVQDVTVTFSGDSLVVINQLNDEWACYEADLVKWIDRIEELLSHLRITPIFEAISRKENREADHLASKSLQGVEITSVKEIEK